MLFEFELEGLEIEANGGEILESDDNEEMTFFDEKYISWATHDLALLDHRSDYKYPFQEGYSADIHPHNWSVNELHAVTEQIRTTR